jgi:hypothetical protein
MHTTLDEDAALAAPNTHEGGIDRSRAMLEVDLSTRLKVPVSHG